MLDTIFAIKFVHVLAAAVMFGTWLAIAVFMVLAHRSRNSSVIALTSRFVVRLEQVVIVAAIVLQPLSGLLLAWAVGLSAVEERWIVLSMAIYGVVTVCWLGAVLVEVRLRNLTREAAISGGALPPPYGRLFRLWSVLACPTLLGMIALFALMIWQPRFD